MIYNSIIETIGNTPIVRLITWGRHVEIYVKIEHSNPMASVRIARLGHHPDAKRGHACRARPSSKLPSATRALRSRWCKPRHHPFVATMAESFSVERRRIMRIMGAKVILTPAAERGSGMVRKAEALAKEHGWFLARQFENEANPAYHRSTTGPEILKDFAGRRLDYWITGWGTGGTLTGAGQMLKLARPDIKIIASEPEGAALLSGKPFAPHKIQGWTPDFIPAVLDREIYDEIVPVADVLARDTALALARSEGIFVGISSGATLAAGLKMAERAPKGSVLLVMLPDTGERYFNPSCSKVTTKAPTTVAEEPR
jgi:cysteine synthase A